MPMILTVIVDLAELLRNSISDTNIIDGAFVRLCIEVVCTLSPVMAIDGRRCEAKGLYKA